MYTKEEIEIVKEIIQSGAITIRDVDNGEKPFVYSSGNQGPGYIMIKGLVGQPNVFHRLIEKLAQKVNQEISVDEFDFIDGNATGGMVCAWELRNQLSRIQNRQIPYVYLRGTRKVGGHDELITGNMNNPLINKDDQVLVVEELVNYAQTTINAARVFRETGYRCTHAATILTYDHEESNQNLRANNVNLIPLMTLPKLLKIAESEGLLPKHCIKSYQEFLRDPVKWQLDRGFNMLPEISAKKAEQRGYTITKLPDDSDKGIIFYLVEEPKYPFLYVALDYPEAKQVVSQAHLLNNACPDPNYGFKINLDTALESGIHGVLSSLPPNRKVFLDLKMWNGSKTMIRVLKQCLNEPNIDIINVYATAGIEFLRSLVDEVKTTSNKPQIFALTMLTHYDGNYTEKVFRMGVQSTITNLANIAEKAGCDGIILPAKYLVDVSKSCSLKKLCPGIRPTGSLNDEDQKYQKQISGLAEAITNGANYLVIGSPITKSENPADSLHKILGEIKEISNSNRS